MSNAMAAEPDSETRSAPAGRGADWIATALLLAVLGVAVLTVVLLTFRRPSF